MRLADLILDSLRRRWGRFAFLGLGLFFAAALSTALFSSAKSMEKEVADSFDQIGSNISIVPSPGSLSITYGGITLAPDGAGQVLTNGDIAKIRGIKNAESLAIIAPKAMGLWEGEGGPITVVGISFPDELKMKKWWEIAGEEPQEERDLLAGEGLARAKGWSLGQTILLGGESFRLAGIIASQGGEEDQLLFMELDQAQGLLKLGDRLTFIEVSAFCSTCPIEDITVQIQNQLPGTRVTAVKDAMVAREGIVARFTALSYVVGGVIVATGVLLVFVLVHANVRERAREFGVFRALGFRKGHILQVVLTEVGLLALLAGEAGYAAGLGLARWLAPQIVQMNVPIGWNWLEAAATVGTTLAIALLAALVPAWRSANQDPVEALRAL